MIYKKVKDEVLLNPLGINSENNLSKATPERALCDVLYLFGNQFFDNIRGINWSLIVKINQDVYANNRIISKWIQENTKQI